MARGAIANESVRTINTASAGLGLRHVQGAANQGGFASTATIFLTTGMKATIVPTKETTPPALRLFSRFDGTFSDITSNIIFLIMPRDGSDGAQRDSATGMADIPLLKQRPVASEMKFWSEGRGASEKSDSGTEPPIPRRLAPLNGLGSGQPMLTLESCPLSEGRPPAL